jgi:hypothetical protein
MVDTFLSAATVKVDFAIDGGEPLFVSIRNVVEPREIEVECDDPKDHRIETKGVNQNCQNDSRLEHREAGADADERPRAKR